ncbi:hypothetical protein GCM10010207_84380 [Streptomyces atratus]|uniref:hypothetical protein n=1 Tax=Streptomyces atratus TaxID=1893 RepID=UPI00167167BD|nr:hypothetical protein [Streptomyces atratus]GGT73901.1 hypothetical protein GCM10010207_84380 [Streptomyces atratus]
MIAIDFLPRPDDKSWHSLEKFGKTPQELTEDDFTFRHFMVDVVIHDRHAGDIPLVAPGLPVVDFLLMLVQMRREVLEAGESTVETSQTQDTIHAVRRGDTVRLHYSFSETVSDMPMGEFLEIPRAGFHAALKVLHSADEELRSNRYLESLTSIFEGS